MSEHKPDCSATVDRECGPCSCGAEDTLPQWMKGAEFMSGDPEAMPKEIAAIRATIEQQAQEIERLEGVCLDRLVSGQKLADEYLLFQQQLAASQARVQVLEKGFADQTAIRERHEAGFTETIAQLQATLAALEDEKAKLKADLYGLSRKLIDCEYKLAEMTARVKELEDERETQP